MMNYQTKNNKIMLSAAIIVVILSCIIICYWFENDRKIDTEIINTSFSGKVKSISYDIKQFSTLYISDTGYYIGFDTGYKIEAGDSVIKKRGSLVYKVIKHDSNKVLYLHN